MARAVFHSIIKMIVMFCVRTLALQRSSTASVPDQQATLRIIRPPHCSPPSPLLYTTPHTFSLFLGSPPSSPHVTNAFRSLQRLALPSPAVRSCPHSSVPRQRHISWNSRDNHERLPPIDTHPAGLTPAERCMQDGLDGLRAPWCFRHLRPLQFCARFMPRNILYLGHSAGAHFRGWCTGCPARPQRGGRPSYRRYTAVHPAGAAPIHVARR